MNYARQLVVKMSKLQVPHARNIEGPLLGLHLHEDLCTESCIGDISYEFPDPEVDA